MEYTFDTNDRPFKAIKEGRKKVEGRVPTDRDKTPYDQFKAGDTINLINNSTNESTKVTVEFVRHYPSAKEMLEAEGPENVLSSEPKTVEHGIESYNLLESYKEGVANNGIYAIGVKPISDPNS